jgi:hypothetical protein
MKETANILRNLYRYLQIYRQLKYVIQNLRSSSRNNETSKYGRDSNLWLTDGGTPIRNFKLEGCSLRTLPSLGGSWQFSLWRTRLGVILPSTVISDQFASVSRSAWCNCRPASSIKRCHINDVKIMVGYLDISLYLSGLLFQILHVATSTVQ